jgi:hypothetical protein
MALRVGGALVLGAWMIVQVNTVKVNHADNLFLSTIELINLEIYAREEVLPGFEYQIDKGVIIKFEYQIIILWQLSS